MVLGHDAALTCEVHGKGLKLITWLSDEGEEVKVDSVATATTLLTSVLELADVTENKNYSCKATFADPDDEILSDLTLVYIDREWLLFIVFKKKPRYCQVTKDNFLMQ